MDRPLDELCDRILEHLEGRSGLELTELASELRAPFALTCVSVGWLARCRVLRLEARPGDRLEVSLEQPVP